MSRSNRYNDFCRFTMERAIAIIGAGICGITAAREIAGRGFDVVLFDKSRGLGGRMATRRAAGVRINHGAPRITPANPELEGLLLAAGADRDALGGWVGKPGMSSIAHALCKGLHIENGQRVAALHETPDGVYLDFEDGARRGPFLRVIVTVPAPQAEALLPAEPELQRRLADVVMSPVWTYMAAFPERIDTSNRMSGPIFHRLSRQSDPDTEMNAPDIWVGHATRQWSEAYLEMPHALVETSMQAAVAAALGRLLPEPIYRAVHRWRFGLVRRPLGEPYLESASGRLLVGGDWTLGPGIGDAWASGRSMAERLLLTLPSSTMRGRDRAWRSDLTS